MTLLRRATESTSDGPTQVIDPKPALLTPMQGATTRRPSFMLAGGLVVALAALVGAWAFSSATSTMSVMVLNRDVAAGEVIAASDLRVVETGSLVGIRSLAPESQELVVGQAARGPMPAGTVISPELFTDRTAVVPEGMAVVGAELSPGAAPAGSLNPGDPVTVLGVARSGGASLESAGAEVVTQGSIWSIERPDNGYNGSFVVGLLVPVDAQGRVAQAAADGLLRVTLVGESS